MEDRHWTGDDMIHRLYGVGRQDEHLEACPECRDRWRHFQVRRAGVLRQPDLPADVLRSQRLRIDERIARGEVRGNWAFQPAAAMALATLFALAGSLQRPAPAPVPQMQAAAASSEAQLFEQVFSEISSAEPQSVQPLHGLFEAKKQ